MDQSIETPPDADRQPDSAAEPSSDRLTRIGNLVVWSLVAVLAAIIGMLLIPLTTAGGVRIPISPVVALVANLVLPRMMWRGTGWGPATFLPAAIWFIVVLAGASATSDGDLLIPGNSYSSVMGLVHMAVGATAAVMGIAIAKMSLRRRRASEKAVTK